MERIYPSFHHISDYGEEGYRTLHRKIATSYPLVLWSPSMALLEQCCERPNSPYQISPDQLIRYIENGYVQIIGREWWFTKDREKRSNWPYAKWTPWDDAIKSILQSSLSIKEEEQRPIRSVGEQKGYNFADQVLKEAKESAVSKVSTKDKGHKKHKVTYKHTVPPIVDTIWDMLQQKQVPAGTRERALSKANEVADKSQAIQKEKAAIEVLRDLRNHADAFVDAKAEGLIISEEDGRFFQLLEKKPEFSTELPAVQQKLLIEVGTEVQHAFERLLDRLESPLTVSSFETFIGSEYHAELVHFMHELNDAAQSWDRGDIDIFVRDKLIERIQSGYHPGKWPPPVKGVEGFAWWGSVLATMAGAAGTMLTSHSGVVDFLTPTGVLTLLGVGFTSVQIVHGALRNIGYMIDYTGPKFPFVYSLGHSPTREKHLEDVLRTIMPENQEEIKNRLRER